MDFVRVRAGIAHRRCLASPRRRAHDDFRPRHIMQSAFYGFSVRSVPISVRSAAPCFGRAEAFPMTVLPLSGVTTRHTCAYTYASLVKSHEEI